MKAMAAMNSMTSRKEKGFTLIELVMVIVILGILAAFALPRFADLGGEARLSSMQGALGAVRSASAIAHSQALVSSVVTGDITLEGKAVTLINGYPNASGIIAAAQLSEEFAITPSPIVETTAVTVTSGTCSFSYTPAVENGAPEITRVIGQVDGGC
jgi:MSHA pilin protein MshA